MVGCNNCGGMLKSPWSRYNKRMDTPIENNEPKSLDDLKYDAQRDVHNYDEVRPWDLLDSKNYTTPEIREGRYKTCLGCERLFRPTRTCKECGCFMAMKTWLENAHCPLGKWND